MIAVIIGPPGAGKSKQSELLRDREHIDWVYVGKLLRKQDDPIVSEAVAAGRLVDDDIVNKLVQEHIDGIDPSQVVVIDGFPRHLPQAEWLLDYSKRSHHKLKAVIHLMVPTATSRDRLKLRAREDDAPQILDQRFEIYENDIAPVIGFFEREGVPIHPVDGNRSVEDVFEDMDRILNNVHQS